MSRRVVRIAAAVVVTVVALVASGAGWAVLRVLPVRADLVQAASLLRDLEGQLGASDLGAARATLDDLARQAHALRATTDAPEGTPA